MKPFYFVFILLLITRPVFSQGDNMEIKKLELTCKIWGFLKYYHPEVAKGKFNWDEELLKILPKIQESKTKIDISNVFLDWIGTLGKVKNCVKCSDQSLNKNHFEENFN